MTTVGAGADPLVSVVIPARNAQCFIAVTIQSVCTQTYTNLEILVVDDGSDDATAEIVQAVAARDPRVRLIRQQHRGVAAARNRAIAESRGAYVAPLDADDIWYPRKLELQVRAMRDARPTVGLVYAWSVYLDERGRLTGGYYAQALPPNVHAALIFRNFIGCASVPLIRRSCLREVGLYNPRYAARGAQGCEDLDLYLRIAERYEFVVVPEFLVGYRQTRGCMSSHTNAMARSFYFVLRDCRARRPEIPWTVFRWSLSRHCFYLHTRARGQGEHGRAVQLLLAALWFDPPFVFRRDLYRHLVAAPWRRFRRVAGRSPADGATAAGAGAGRQRRPGALPRPARPSPLFDVCETVYQRRLRFTEGLLDRARHARFAAERPVALTEPRPEPPA